jgi:Holliday junction DNA helicase RuvA
VIDFLEGRLVVNEPTRAVIDCQGIGYELLIPLSTHDALPTVGVVARLLTVLIVRDDAYLLCGFASPDERSMFKLLTSVTGVGPKIALMAISRVPLQELANSITTGDITAVQRLPGVGRKLAARIIAELQESMSIGGGVGLSSPGGEATGPSAVAEAQSALIGLGYGPNEARRVVAAVAREHPTADVETLIRTAITT